jgi:two-component system sensor histidine kinase KdpD
MIARRAQLWRWVIWVGLLVGVTAVMNSARGELDQAHVVLAYLLVVLGASATAGRTMGVVLACAGFLLLDYFFQKPYDTFSVPKPLDWVVLIAFLCTAMVATQLLTRARAEAEEARRRATEVASLAQLGSESLGAGRAEDALTRITEVIRATLGIAECAVLGAQEVDLPSPANNGRTLFLPLQVQGRPVGVLRLSDPNPIELDAAQRRFLDALTYYASLGVERVHLVAAAEHAEALRETNRLKDELLASVSHDLRTPLTTIKALAQSAALRGDSAAAAIEEQADRLTRLVSDLLDLSRMKANSFEVKPELNTAEDLLGAAVRQAQGLLNGRSIRTSVDLDSPALVGHFDFIHSLRILGNLLENAIRHSPADAPIDLSVRREREMLVFTVGDRGPGVPDADVGRIFEPLFRSPSAPRGSGRAGLGLSIARRLAEIQRGSLGFEPRSGGGSSFILRLPAVELSEGALDEA